VVINGPRPSFVVTSRVREKWMWRWRCLAIERTAQGSCCIDVCEEPMYLVAAWQLGQLPAQSAPRWVWR